MVGRRSTGDPPQADYRSVSRATHEFGGSYESECRPEGPYGALKQVPEGPYGALKKDAQFGKRHSKWVGPKAVPRIVFHFPNHTPFIRASRAVSLLLSAAWVAAMNQRRNRRLSVKT